MATIVGQRGWDGMADWAKDSEEYLAPLLELPNGMPSADTLRRVIGALDPVAFRDAFIAWAEALNGSPLGKHVAIDGKTVRGSFASKEGEGALHLINAWAIENRAVLGQVTTDVKSNEITAIPELIALLNLRGAVVTIRRACNVASIYRASWRALSVLRADARSLAGGEQAALGA